LSFVSHTQSSENENTDEILNCIIISLEQIFEQKQRHMAWQG